MDRRSINLAARLGAAVLALTVAACTGASPQAPAATPAPTPVPPPTPMPTESGIEHPTGPTDLVIRYEQVGGFIAPIASYTLIPAISIYGDGRVFTLGAVPAIYPGPAYPPILVATLAPGELQRLIEAARDAGLLGPDADYEGGLVADASTARFTVNAGGRTHVFTAYALSESRSDEGLDQATIEARKKLASFRDLLLGLQAAPATTIGPWTSAEPTAVRLIVGDAPDPGTVPQVPIEWPLATPLASFGEPLPDMGGGVRPGGQRCGSVAGADLATLLPLLRQANQLTPWTSEGASFGLEIRPLLPDESGCDVVPYM